MSSRFLTALLSANKETQAWFYSKQIPQKVFNSGKAEIKWVYAFRESYGYYPSRSAFISHFPKFELGPSKSGALHDALEQVIDEFALREIGRVVENTRELHQTGSPIKKVLGYFKQAASDISMLDQTYVDINHASTSVSLDRYRQRVKGREAGTTNFNPSPWPIYNDMVGFSEYGEHTLIASRTSIGKTWLLLFWAIHMQLTGEKVLIVSKEMPSEQIADRLEAIRFKLNYPKFRRGQLPPRELGRWRRERRDYKEENPLIISGSDSLKGTGFSQLLTKINQYAPTAMLVDGAYLLQPEEVSKNASSVERLTLVSNTMKRIAMVHKLRAMSVVQINRSGENSKGETKASLKDIYGADAWAQDADNVVLLSGQRGANHRLFQLAKGRESNVGEFNIRFQLDPCPDFAQTEEGFFDRQSREEQIGGKITFEA